MRIAGERRCVNLIIPRIVGSYRRAPAIGDLLACTFHGTQRVVGVEGLASPGDDLVDTPVREAGGGSDGA